MAYRIQFKPAAQRDLRAMSKEDSAGVLIAIQRFAETGDGDVKKLRNDPKGRWRLRWGKWRVLYTASGEVLRILRVMDRKDAYR